MSSTDHEYIQMLGGAKPMSAPVINQIIIIANDEMRRARERLEVEESGRELAALQGNLVGYKNLVAHMAAEFELPQIFIEDSGDAPLRIPELDDEVLETFAVEVETLKDDRRWESVEARIDHDIGELKNHLLFKAEKSRDLDLCQGQYKGETVYTRLFEKVRDELERRHAAQAKKAKEPELFEAPVN
jgi:hypothetical protein